MVKAIQRCTCALTEVALSGTPRSEVQEEVECAPSPHLALTLKVTTLPHGPPRPRSGSHPRSLNLSCGRRWRAWAPRGRWNFLCATTSPPSSSTCSGCCSSRATAASRRTSCGASGSPPTRESAATQASDMTRVRVRTCADWFCHCTRIMYRELKDADKEKERDKMVTWTRSRLHSQKQKHLFEVKNKQNDV